MNDNELAFFKNLLETWLADLRYRADDAMKGMRNVDVSLPDPIDRASHDTESSFQLRIRDRESILIRKIKQSLQDIENGEYGVCQSCGQDISIARMNARPVARHCIQCKTEMENREKTTGT